MLLYVHSKIIGMVTKKGIETRSCWINLIADNEPIVRVEKKSGIETISEDLEEIDRAYEHLIGTQSAKFLIVFQKDCNSDNEFKKRAVGKERSTIKKAEAMIVKSLANRIEADFYINYFKPQHPVAVFNSETAGLKWLKTIAN